MSAAPFIPEPLWREALEIRHEEHAARIAKESRTVLARLALQRMLLRAGWPVGLVSIGVWPRHEQGRAYLWAIAFIEGREDLPPPQFVVDAARCEERSR